MCVSLGFVDGGLSGGIIMNDLYCVELWKLVVGIGLMFLSGSAGVMFAQSHGLRGFIWGISGCLVSVCGILLILSPSVAGGA